VQLSVRLLLEEVDQFRIRFEVLDTGRGMTPEQVKSAMDIYVRSSPEEGTYIDIFL
jgi:signal transduction histidine kinase